MSSWFSTLDWIFFIVLYNGRRARVCFHLLFCSFQLRLSPPLILLRRPLIVRSWRIISIHSPTLECSTCRFQDGLTQQKRRSHAWILPRLAAGLAYNAVNSVISIITVPTILPLNTMDWVMESYNLFTTTVLLVVSIWHLAIRKNIRYEVAPCLV